VNGTVFYLELFFTLFLSRLSRQVGIVTPLLVERGWGRGKFFVVAFLFPTLPISRDRHPSPLVERGWGRGRQVQVISQL